MKNIFLIPTESSSRLHYYDHMSNLGLSKDYLQWKQGRNIYITSDEEIKESFRGWFIGQCGFYKKCVDTKIINNELYLLDYLGNTDRLIWCKKIILTTDRDLNKDGVQAIDDDFLEWFIKNPSCTRVEVSYEQDENGVFHHVIWGMHFKEDLPNQETLEEAAERIAKEHCNNRVNPNTTEFQVQQFIIKGAKWQSKQLFENETIQTLEKCIELLLKKQEKTYSEEEVLELLNKREDYINSEDDIFNYKSNKEWFEQFKKKE